jgi:hypothetical protein
MNRKPQNTSGVAFSLGSIRKPEDTSGIAVALGTVSTRLASVALMGQTKEGLTHLMKESIH